MNPARTTEPLVDYLLELARREDRRSLAMLRRSLGPGCEAAAYPVVARFFPAERRPVLERALLTVAGLFATHPVQAPRSLAKALQMLAAKKGSGSIESRFLALLDARSEDVRQHLRRLVALLASEGLAFDWNDLLRALKRWDFEGNRTRRQWARDFWSESVGPREEAEKDS